MNITTATTTTTNSTTTPRAAPAATAPAATATAAPAVTATAASANVAIPGGEIPALSAVSLPDPASPREGTVREALDAYFAASGFDESTYGADWADIPLGPVPFRFPNTAGRKRILPLHDLHHALTGYPATLRGEMQIGAWEIGGGIGRHWIGWILNLLTLAGGAFLFPGTAFRSFVRGRRSTNLYRRAPEPDIYDRDLHEVRAERGIDASPRARAGDVAAFVGWTAVALAVGVVSLVTMPLMAALGLWGALSSRR